MIIYIPATNNEIMSDLIFPILVYVITYLITELILKPLCVKILKFYKHYKKTFFYLTLQTAL